MFYYKDSKSVSYMGAGECGISEPGKWHHVAFTIDGNSNGVLYVDAQPKATFKSSVRPTTTSRFSMGQEWDGDMFVNLRSSNHFAGGKGYPTITTTICLSDLVTVSLLT